MLIAFECPYCGTKQEADAALSGRRVTCSTCGKALAVPVIPDKVANALGIARQGRHFGTEQNSRNAVGNSGDLNSSAASQPRRRSGIWSLKGLIILVAVAVFLLLCGYGMSRLLPPKWTTSESGEKVNLANQVGGFLRAAGGCLLMVGCLGYTFALSHLTFFGSANRNPYDDSHAFGAAGCVIFVMGIFGTALLLLAAFIEFCTYLRA